MASQYFFNGRLYTTPATMSAVNDSAMQPTNPTVGNVLAILGPCDGGQSNVALSFGDPDQVAPVLMSGPLCTAVQKAFNPSNETNAPSVVVAVRVGASTQAALTLNDSTAAAAITLTSVQYGIYANRTKIKVAAGSVSGLQVSVQNGNSYIVGDNLARNAFTVQYAGAAASAAMQVSPTAVTLQAPSGTVVATISLAVYSTVAELVDAISAVSGFTATASPGNSTTYALNGLDSVATADVKTALYTATANLQAVIDWLNSGAQPYVVATRPATAGLPPALIGWTYLAGGTATAPATADWTNALSMLQGEDVQWVVALSGDPAIHAAVDAHVQYMSTVGQRERRAFVGPVVGTALSAVEALPLAIDSDRTAMVWPGYYDYDVNGILTLYDPFYSAALLAAGFAGLSPGETMSNKTLTVRGLEVTVRNPTDTDALINAGVCALEMTSAGYKVVRAISTWLVDDKFDKVEVSCGAATDYAVRSWRTALDVVRGMRGDPLVLSRALTISESILLALSVPPPDGPGVLVGDANSPSFTGLKATLSGDVVSVSGQISPVIPVNFVPININLVPYSGTASA